MIDYHTHTQNFVYVIRLTIPRLPSSVRRRPPRPLTGVVNEMTFLLCYMGALSDRNVGCNELGTSNPSWLRHTHGW
jgi:hypothetical protein